MKSIILFLIISEKLALLKLSIFSFDYQVSNDLDTSRTDYLELIITTIIRKNYLMFKSEELQPNNIAFCERRLDGVDIRVGVTDLNSIFILKPSVIFRER